MKDWIFKIAVAVVFAVVIWNLWPIMTGSKGKGYDCSMASFHPDYPTAVREKCRSLQK